jgi:hypothetical protein
MNKISLVLIAIVVTLLSCTKSFDSKADSSSIVGGGTYSGAASSSGGSGNGGDSTIPSGVLTAGEWNDLDNWNFLQNLYNTNDTISKSQSYWGFYCKSKWLFQITDANQKPVENAVITITNNGKNVYTVRTNKFGTAHVLPAIFDSALASTYNYTISYNGLTAANGLLNATTQTINYSLPTTASVFNAVDIMFVIDATGSMGDELEYLKNELYNVLSRADSALMNRQVRYSAVFYRDVSDDYLTKPYNFTTDKSSVVNFVKAQSAGGGGDTPEAVDEGLTTALKQQWSNDAHAKMMFLILDAPPHGNKMDIVRSKIKEAAEKGIMLIPIAASGTDKTTEFLLRYMAIATNGTYTFLTNHSGIGNAHITPTIGNYKVEYLNNLMVRLISKYAGN